MYGKELWAHKILTKKQKFKWLKSHKNIQRGEEYRISFKKIAYKNISILKRK